MWPDLYFPPINLYNFKEWRFDYWISKRAERKTKQALQEDKEREEERKHQQRLLQETYQRSKNYS